MSAHLPLIFQFVVVLLGSTTEILDCFGSWRLLENRMNALCLRYLLGNEKSIFNNDVYRYD